MTNIKNFNPASVKLNDSFVFMGLDPVKEGIAPSFVICETLKVSKVNENPWTGETYPEEFVSVSNSDICAVYTVKDLLNTFTVYYPLKDLVKIITECYPEDADDEKPVLRTRGVVNE